MSTDLWLRKIKLQVEGLLLEDYHVRFNVALSDNPKTSNTATIQISNLGEHHRHQLERMKKVYVDLYAGYETSMPLLFRGDLYTVFSEHSGATWTTTISADTSRVAKKKRVVKSFAPGASIGDIFQHLAKEMDLKISSGSIKVAEAAIKKSRARQFFNGYSLAGTTRDELERLCRSCGFEWQAHNGKLHLVPLSKALTDSEFVLSAKTGLIGRPKVGNYGLIDVQCLLIPDLYPYRRVYLDSVQINAPCVIKTAKLAGDTRSQQWAANLELKLE